MKVYWISRIPQRRKRKQMASWTGGTGRHSWIAFGFKHWHQYSWQPGASLGLVEMGIHGISKGLGVWKDHATLWSSIAMGIRNMSSHQDVRVILRIIQITMEHNHTAPWSVVLVHSLIVRKTIHIRLIWLLQNYKLKATVFMMPPTVYICFSAPFSLNFASTLWFITACLCVIYLGSTWLSRILVSVLKPKCNSWAPTSSTCSRGHLLPLSPLGNPGNPIYFHEAVEWLNLSMSTAWSKAHLCSYISKQWWLKSWCALLDLAAFTSFSTKPSEVKMCHRPVQQNLASNSKWRKMHIHRDKELASEKAPPKVLQGHTLICVYWQWLWTPISPLESLPHKINRINEICIRTDCALFQSNQQGREGCQWWGGWTPTLPWCSGRGEDARVHCGGLSSPKWHPSGL